jgi:hypothetical protein
MILSGGFERPELVFFMSTRIDPDPGFAKAQVVGVFYEIWKGLVG